ncbi:TPA: helicase-exonuclease AddAB subunit AddA [Staphylococcus argenteus]|uniref:helicase-exonuclease AddAB subunit AddA n=1 Tax=Staphylococcus argenteus TaxID=985002 RepID=UPI000233FE59|nr:helicase-exonuclease AddAB subunit AddA [Staphylococcus argenteus]MBE2130307.1 helicase-exonuclease AddAB subunit AddA [Staphylococcus argenteus]PNY93103.1 helicase-exonuclease AddAB subunit AddA [Staphylococcus argenteus]CCE58673.1 ATP-dependent helicase/nuclease subunit A, putative [Staphylococcus argenteus]SUJ07222.1 ATP-dependent nuclease, subunit A [Staphylococcus argenteus]HDY9428312.1 helicase-exonuclease AddAB subunit AddA [Staphylococcus argenteus]
MTIPEKPQGVIWTDAQWQSIYASGQDVLVAAAAGSGKTAVLVERIIQKILRDGIDVDRLLVVTFTNLSAREMKHRVDQRIQEASIADPMNTHLKNQRIKIHQAQISTLHSFCLKLIQQHYDVLNIDPNFRTSSEAENILLLEQTIDEVIEQHYDILDPAFIELTEQLSSDRSDDQFRAIIKQLYFFSIANPNPSQWLDQLVLPYQDEAQQEQLIQLLTNLSKVFLTAANDALNKSYDLFSMMDGVEKHLAIIEDERRLMARVLEDGIIDISFLTGHEFGARLPNVTAKIKEANEMMVDALEDAKLQYKKYKSLIDKVKNDYFSREANDLKEDMQLLAPRVKYLARIVKDVMSEFNRKKRSKNILDFSDYEHFALQILTNEDGTPSEIAESYRQHFHEILVDEYQDTNRVQEKILSCIKIGDEQNGNLFMVGDVKQSIYKFRQADPSLFIEKYQRFTLDGAGSGRRIDLSQNFRSRKEVLATTNYLFKHMMDEQVGEVNYDAAAQLYYGAPFDETNYPVNLKVLVEANQEHSDLTGSEQEAHFIVEQVKDILEHQKVYDMKSQSYRSATYKDIVILERSFGQARNLQQAFKNEDIPFHVNSREGYFEQTEVRLVLSFLRAVDNPLQDIYLVGLMRSVIYQFKEDELAQIRILSPNDDYFYQSIVNYIKDEEADTALVEKLKLFLKDIKRYQQYSQDHPVYQLIDQFYNDHYVIQYFSGLIGGRGRRANLYGLFNKAIEFENSSFRGLYQFIRFIDELIDRGKDFGEENVVGPNDNVVRMMTIHSSKGLEFPFVIYSGLSKDFNKRDLKQPVILNQQYGLGMDYFDVEKEMAYPSLASVAYKAVAEKELVSEEMRLIYVALTRAKEQLYLIGRVKNDKSLQELEQLSISGEHIAVNERLTSPNPFQLIYGILAKHQSTSLPDDLKFEKDIMQVEDSSRPNVKIAVEYFEDISTEAVLENDEYHSVNQLKEMTKGNEDTKAKIKYQLSYQYPYEQDTLKPSKQSVSELKRQLETEESGTSYERVRQYRIGFSTYERPKFLSEQGKRKANEIGTLMHTVMQHLPFKMERLSEVELNLYIDDLIDKHIIEQDAKKDIRVNEIMSFINSDLYLSIAQADQVYRELPFVVNQALVDQLPPTDEDASIIQGMIDLIFVKNGVHYFVDYKTDAFNRRRGMTDEEIGAQLKNKYKIQMKYYQNTLQTILNTDVKGYLYFFKFGTLQL